jgi:hypothetical protein
MIYDDSMTAMSISSCLRARLQPCRKRPCLNGALAPEVRSSPLRTSGNTPRFLIILLTSIFLCCGTLVAQQNRPGYFVPGPIQEVQIPSVSIIQLIANPQRYNGKRIRIIGYLRLEFEGNAIYLHREDYEQEISENAVWINPPSALTKEQINAVNNGYVICTGVFHGNQHGHMDMFSGEISNINRLEPWSMGQTATKPASSK